MEKGLCVLLVGVFTGVFVGALAVKLARKTDWGQRASEKISEGLEAAKDAFVEGYRPKAAQEG